MLVLTNTNSYLLLYQFSVFLIFFLCWSWLVAVWSLFLLSQNECGMDLILSVYVRALRENFRKETGQEICRFLGVWVPQITTKNILNFVFYCSCVPWRLSLHYLSNLMCGKKKFRGIKMISKKFFMLKKRNIPAKKGWYEHYKIDVNVVIATVIRH